MTRLASLLRLADSCIADSDKRIRDIYECGRMEAIRTLEALAREAVETRTKLATSISALLSPPNTCGWERPVAIDDGVTIPASWAACVSPADARAMAVMLLVAADSAEENQ